MLGCHPPCSPLPFGVPCCQLCPCPIHACSCQRRRGRALSLASRQKSDADTHGPAQAPRFWCPRGSVVHTARVVRLLRASPAPRGALGYSSPGGFVSDRRVIPKKASMFPKCHVPLPPPAVHQHPSVLPGVPFPWPPPRSTCPLCHLADLQANFP